MKTEGNVDGLRSIGWVNSLTKTAEAVKPKITCSPIKRRFICENITVNVIEVAMKRLDFTYENVATHSKPYVSGLYNVKNLKEKYPENKDLSEKEQKQLVSEPRFTFMPGRNEGTQKGEGRHKKCFFLNNRGAKEVFLWPKETKD